MRTCSVIGCQNFKQGYKPSLLKEPIENELEWTATVLKLNNQIKELEHVCFEHLTSNDVKITFLLPIDLGHSDVTLVSINYITYLNYCGNTN